MIMTKTTQCIKCFKMEKGLFIFSKLNDVRNYKCRKCLEDKE